MLRDTKCFGVGFNMGFLRLLQENGNQCGEVFFFDMAAPKKRISGSFMRVAALDLPDGTL